MYGVFNSGGLMNGPMTYDDACHKAEQYDRLVYVAPVCKICKAEDEAICNLSGCKGKK